MAVKIWRGGAPSIAQVTKITFSAYTSGQTYSITINSKTVSYVATASTITNVVDGLIAAIQATIESEYAEITATSDSGLVLTAITFGYPFTVTASATGGITETITETTAATGPNYFNNADNWEGGVAPVAGDDLVFENSTIDVLYNIVSATNFGDITIDSTFTGAIGLPVENSNGYREYRPRFLKLGDGSSAYAITLGQGLGRQSPRILIDANGADITAAIYSTGSTQNEEYPFVLKNTDTASVIDVYGGSVHIDADTAGTLATLRVTPAEGFTQTNVLTDQTVSAGAITATGGTINIRGASTSIDISNGAQARFTNASTCPTVRVSSGASVHWGSTAGITTKAYVYAQGTLDFSSNGASKAVQAADLFNGGILRDPSGIITWTTGIVLQGCKLDQVQLDIGRARTLTVA